MSQNHKLAFTNTGSEKQKNLCITPPQKFGILPRPMPGTCTSSFPVHTLAGCLAAVGLQAPVAQSYTPLLPSLHQLPVREYLFQEVVLVSPWEERGQPALSKPQFSILRFRD